MLCYLQDESCIRRIINNTVAIKQSETVTTWYKNLFLTSPKPIVMNRLTPQKGCYAIISQLPKTAAVITMSIIKFCRRARWSDITLQIKKFKAFHE